VAELFERATVEELTSSAGIAVLRDATARG
jgi:hypothetical protein